MRIADGSIVELDYDIFDAEGELVETTSEEGPIEYVHGQGDLLPGLEKALTGHGQGEELRLTLAAGEAYGDYNPDGLVTVPRDDLPADQELNTGDWITVVATEEEDEDEEVPAKEDLGEIEMRVVEADDEAVVLDANHPLAGQAVTFRLKVVSVRAS